MVTTSPIPPTKKSKAPWIIGGVFALLLLTGAVIAIVNIAPFISVITNSAQKNSNYDERVAAMADAKKDFSKGETLVSGPVSITVTGAESNYQPNEQQAAYIEKMKTSDLRRRDNEYSVERYAWNASDPRYVLVTTDVTYDSDIAKYPTPDGGQLDVVTSAHFGVYAPVIVWVNDVALESPSSGIDYKLTKSFGAEPTKVAYLVRVPKDTNTSTLEFESTIFAKVSSIVGTEGMPRQSFVYTLAIE